MNHFSAEQIQQAKGTANPEELMELAKSLHIEMTADEAKCFFEQLHPASGELSDEELDNVSGGGCKTSGGYTVVTSATKCFTGKYESAQCKEYVGTPAEITVWQNTSNMSLRQTWWNMSGWPGRCGNCRYLEFDGGTGYCSKS